MSADSYVHLDLPGAAAAAPVLFLFHGTGGDEHQFVDLAAQLLPGARRVGVRGDVSEQGALRYFRRLAEGRYDMADLARAQQKLAGFVTAKLAAERPELVAGLGYSNGANILAAVQFVAPELFDRVVLLHPLIPFVPEPQPGLAGKQVLITAGRRDPICPPAASQALADWYQAQGAEVRLEWHEGGHEIAQAELLAARDFLAGGVAAA